MMGYFPDGPDQRIGKKDQGSLTVVRAWKTSPITFEREPSIPRDPIKKPGFRMIFASSDVASFEKCNEEEAVATAANCSTRVFLRLDGQTIRLKELSRDLFRENSDSFDTEFNSSPLCGKRTIGKIHDLDIRPLWRREVFYFLIKRMGVFCHGRCSDWAPLVPCARDIHLPGLPRHLGQVSPMAKNTA